MSLEWLLLYITETDQFMLCLDPRMILNDPLKTFVESRGFTSFGQVKFRSQFFFVLCKESCCFHCNNVLFMGS